jgi:alanyl-tRNA synthetase
LASAVVVGSGAVALVIGDGEPSPVVVARSPDVGFDAGAWLRSATARLGGRGGGRPELAQGGIPAPAAAVMDLLRESIRRGAPPTE